MNETLNKLVSENSVAEVCENRSTPSLLLAVLLKYGIAPIACIYLGWVLLQKDETIQKNSDRLVELVERSTAASVKQTQVQERLIIVIETNTSKLSDLEKDRRIR